MTARRPLLYHSVLGLIDVTIIAMAMISFSAGIGVIGGVVLARVIFAVRELRSERRRAAQSRVLDDRLAAALARFQSPAVIDSPTEDPRLP